MQLLQDPESGLILQTDSLCMQRPPLSSVLHCHTQLHVFFGGFIMCHGLSTSTAWYYMTHRQTKIKNKTKQTGALGWLKKIHNNRKQPKTEPFSMPRERQVHWSLSNKPCSVESSICPTTRGGGRQVPATCWFLGLLPLGLMLSLNLNNAPPPFK